MARKSQTTGRDVDALVKALLCLSRTVDEVLDAQAVAAAAGDWQLSPSKVRLMKLIAHSGKQMIGQIARFLGVSDPAASQLSDALAQQGLVVRHSNPTDRRSAYVRLTRTGRTVVAAIEREQCHRVRHALGSTSQNGHDAWAAQLRALARLLGASERAYEDLCMQCRAYHDNGCLIADAPEGCVYRRHEARAKRRSRARAVAVSARRNTRPRASGEPRTN